MTYLLGEIVLYLGLAAALGLAVGWLLQSVRQGHRLRRLDDFWQGKSGQQGQRLMAARQQLAVDAAKLEEARRDLRAARERVAELEADLVQRHAAEGPAPGEHVAGLHARIADLESAIGERDARIDALDAAHREALHAKEAEIEKLAAGLAQSERRAARPNDSALAQLRADHRAALERKDAELGRLQKFIDQVEPVVAEAEQSEARLRTVELQYRKALEDRDAEIARLRRALEADAAPRAGTAAAQDDLTRIRGIGPALARKLNRLGVQRYRQIATWNADDVARVSAELGAFRGRIERDGWVESAKREHRSKYGESL